MIGIATNYVTKKPCEPPPKINNSNYYVYILIINLLIYKLIMSDINTRRRFLEEEYCVTASIRNGKNLTGSKRYLL